MKLKNLGSALLLLAILMTISCKKDTKETKNYFKYNEKEALIGTALSESYGETSTTGVYASYVYFLEKT